MEDHRRVRNLKLVPSPSGSPHKGSIPLRRVTERPTHIQAVLAPHEESKGSPGEQLSLFPLSKPSLLGIVNMERISGNRFAELLGDIRPRWLIDLRPLPRFDIDHMNRRRAFDLFERYGVDYRDVAGLLGIASRTDASLSSGRIADEVIKILIESGVKSSPGPIIFLVDDDELAQASTTVFPKRLRPRPKGGWETQILR